MRKLKECKGFEDKLCLTCKRMSTKIDTTLVKGLANNKNGERKHCVHYIH